jgi:glutamate/tyrosine decarboxylase-like PLP-dependent enzyme
LFNPAPAFPAACADRIVGAFNPQLASWKTSPASVEIESHVIRAVACRAGFGPKVTGHFTNGGAEANFAALLCALMHADKEYGTIGARAFPLPLCSMFLRKATLLGLR